MRIQQPAMSSISVAPAEITDPASAVPVVKKVCGFWHIMLFTMSFVLGDVMVTWTAGLSNGFPSYMVAKFTFGTAFICLTLCQAEMTSMLPFSGGSYGFARVTLGPFVGFIVGYMEALSNFMFTVEVAEHFGYLVQIMMGSTSQLRPVYWLFFYIPAVSLLVSGSKYFYPVTAGLAVFSLTVIAVYLLGTSPDTDFMQYVVNSDDREIFPGGAGSIMKVLHISAQLWLGVQSVTLACEDTDDATMVVPKAMLSGVVVVFLLSFLITLSISSQYPGVVEVEHIEAPMSYGLANILNIPRAAATIFSLFAVFSVGLTHMFAYSRQMMALARSRLCWVHLKNNLGISDAPAVAILGGSALSYGLNLMVWGGYQNEVHILLRISRLYNLINYLVIFASFLVFKISFSSMQRKFTNPIGYLSVAYGTSIVLLALLGILVWDEQHNMSKLVCAASLGVMLLYYYFVASKVQTYSKEEQHLLLKLYVIKGNVQKRKNIGKKAAATGGKFHRGRGIQGSRGGRGSGGSGTGSGSGSGSSDQESDIDSTPLGGSGGGSQGAFESIAEEEQEQDKDIPGSLDLRTSALSGQLSFAAKAVQDALASFSPALKVHPLPISGTGSKREREDKPPAEDDEVRSTYFPVSDLFGGEGQSDAKGGQKSTSTPQVGTKEDELRP
ncbi:hypothetical protein B484DRAFT_420765 [Ochromonadaceae sp. CCMP2298]|nr:hypothetical protein B484DRAFT_420765 [Ochromonadaceae sp. CCMP2298]|mmetsp:Transcript_12652/g.28086  ORF Transcript_12652/g.28086 Transcript_12652/m.28086 type:complete len:667 (+) Transcript_12652:268-2268(+)